ncbi:hypothetical protein D9757_004029 [Collybiopsis confluens]|uniref:PARP catalytic domain-containing protein n=1 Tax=Collybiopsis confluens TaxID=2823264 RepID=A0A8H5HX20_9AGAR|nr:hypothetical protein D9757_004029 [Collybiopsis confluens]
MTMAATVASHLPLALSLLHTVATQYPGLTKSQPTTTTSTNSSPPSAPAATLTLAFPGSGSNGNGNNNGSGTNGNQPAQSGSSSVPLGGGGTIPSTPPAASASNGSQLCQHCNIKPKYFDGIKTHLYCSKSCAANASKGNANQRASSSQSSTASSSSIVAVGNCDFCGSRPKFSGHPFCSKACAKNATSSFTNGGNPKGKKWLISQATDCRKRLSIDLVFLSLKEFVKLPVVRNLPTSTRMELVEIIARCRTKRRLFSELGLSPSEDLKNPSLGETLCLMCLQSPKQANSHFCGKVCADNAEMKGPMLLAVPVGHVTFTGVSEQFKASWRHVGTKCPTVKRIYKIVSPQASLAAYNAYKAAVEAKGQFAAAGRSAGNENRRWHGTKRECHLGDKGQTQFCSSPTCSLCCIVKTSFDLTLFGKKTGWGRFGKGIYTSSTSSKSNDYSTNENRCSLKAMLLNKVIVGKGCKLTQDNTILTAPPAGYDSVLAEKGGSLNYDELVVYTNDAIRPSFLVMYEA